MFFHKLGTVYTICGQWDNTCSNAWFFKIIFFIKQLQNFAGGGRYSQQGFTGFEAENQGKTFLFLSIKCSIVIL